METQLKLSALALLSSLILHPSSLPAQGSLTPPGAPAPTMKTLGQVEPRTPISSAPYTITTPGSYYLTTNLTVSTGNGITINIDGVTLDLNGFTISSTAPIATGFGISALNRRNITVANGFIKGGVTNNGSGTYSGIGFSYGIYGASSTNVLVDKVSVSGCRDYGIYLFLGSSTMVESCMVQTVGSFGIYASSVKGSWAADCGSHAIYGFQVSDSYGQSSGGAGVYATATALNCYGYSSGSGNGVNAKIAQNCHGHSSSGYGVYATATASGCYGFSPSGTGLHAFIANVCVGETATGTALSTTHNVNSY